MLFHGLQKVIRTSWLIAAAGVRTGQPVDERRNDSLIDADKEPDDPSHGGSWCCRIGEQSSAAGKLDPLGLQHSEFCIHRRMPRNGDDEMRADDLWCDGCRDGREPSPDLVAGDRIAKPAGHREAKSGLAFFWEGHDGKNQQPSGPRNPLLANGAKFAGPADALRPGQSHE